MRTLRTRNQAVMEITVKMNGDIETFLFYESESYAEILKAINATQGKEMVRF